MAYKSQIAGSHRSTKMTYNQFNGVFYSSNPLTNHGTSTTVTYQYSYATHDHNVDSFIYFNVDQSAHKNLRLTEIYSHLDSVFVNGSLSFSSGAAFSGSNSDFDASASYLNFRFYSGTTNSISNFKLYFVCEPFEPIMYDGNYSDDYNLQGTGLTVGDIVVNTGGNISVTYPVDGEFITVTAESVTYDADTQAANVVVDNDTTVNVQYTGDGIVFVVVDNSVTQAFFYSYEGVGPEGVDGTGSAADDDGDGDNGSGSSGGSGGGFWDWLKKAVGDVLQAIWDGIIGLLKRIIEAITDILFKILTGLWDVISGFLTGAIGRLSDFFGLFNGGSGVFDYFDGGTSWEY